MGSSNPGVLWDDAGVSLRETGTNQFAAPFCCSAQKDVGVASIHQDQLVAGPHFGFVWGSSSGFVCYFFLIIT